MGKKNLILFLLILNCIVIHSKEKDFKVAILMFNVEEYGEESLSFLEKNISEMLLKQMKKNKSIEQYTLELAWEKSDKYKDWVAKSEVSAYEYGRELDVDYVIYGELTQRAKGYKLDTSILSL